MKRGLRIARRIVFTLLAFAAALAVATLDFVDYTPYVRTAYYKETRARLESASKTNALARGELFAGFGRARLTPTLGAAEADPTHGKFKALPLAGYGNRQGKPATGAHDDLFVKAAAIRVAGRTGIMFGCDALIVPREVSDAAAERLASELGLRREQLYFSASHTHCSIGGWGEGIVGEMFAGGFDPGSRAWFTECIVQAAREAVNDLKPAQFGHGSFAAREYIRNRLVGDLGKVDPEFSFIVLKQNKGRTGILGSYSAHATVLSGSMMEYSADYPGAWQRAMENTVDGIAIFLGGAVGSHGPVPGDHGTNGTERMGKALANLLAPEIARASLTNIIAFETLAVDVAMPPLNTRLADGIRLRPWAAKRLLPALKPSFLQGFRLDEMIWLSTPCDFSGEMALAIKDLARARGFGAVVTSFNGDYVGYVIPPRYYHLPGYEPRTMSFYGPNVPEYFDELLRAIEMELIAK